MTLAAYTGKSVRCVLSRIMRGVSIRFASFEQYKKALTDSSGKLRTGSVILGALCDRLIPSTSQGAHLTFVATLYAHATKAKEVFILDNIMLQHKTNPAFIVSGLASQRALRI